MSFALLKNIRTLDPQDIAKQMIIPCLFVLLLIPAFSNLPNVSGEISCFTSLTQTTDSNYKGGVFVDSYWTDRSASSDQSTNQPELEVGPGEGPSTLAVVLTNTSNEELIGVKGYLDLPKGFAPYGLSIDPKFAAYFDSTKGASSTTATASYPGIIGPGETITLYFDVNISNYTTVGAKAGQLIADYTTVKLKNTCKSALMNIPFILPGKVILDAVAQNQYLYPETSNPVTISISNKGSADATGVIATIVGLGEQGSRGSGSGSSVTLQSSDTNLVNLGPNTFNLGTIPAGKTIDISTVIFPDTTAAATVQNLDLQITYGNSYGYKQTIAQTTGLVISPQPAESSLVVTSSSEVSPPLITAGQVDDYKFEIKNNGKSPMTNILLTLASGSDSVKIVGNSKWTIDDLPAGNTKYLTAEIFSSTSIINTPISFTLTSEYLSNGESKTDTSTLGAYVSGNINLVLYDVGVNQIGDVLYVVGNVLNQGSTTGKFASIELVTYPAQASQDTESTSSKEAMAQNNQGESGKINQNQKLAPQYLGDLNEESSIPFSIPLPMRSLSPGTYPFSFKIVYADDLKNFHEIEVNQQVNVNPVQQLGGGNQRPGGGSSDDLFTFVILGLVGGSAVTVVVVVKKRKFSKLKFKTQNNFNDDDLEKLLDSSTAATKNNSAKKSN